MFLRAPPLHRQVSHSLSRAPAAHQPSIHFTKHCHIRTAPQFPPYSSTRARRAYTSNQSISAAPFTRSGTGLWTVAIVAALAVGGALVIPWVQGSSNIPTSNSIPLSQFDPSVLTDSYLVMAPNTPAGRPGTLSPEEEKKLRQLWAMTLKVFGVETHAQVEEANGVEHAAASTPAVDEKAADGKKDKKKSKLNVFRRNKGDKGAEADSTPASGTATPASDIGSLSISAEDDKHGQTAEYKAALANTAPEDLRQAFWSMVKHDHPDALLLRFLRARKWDVEKALVMMISTMHWRLTEQHVDDDIVKVGELGALEQTKGESDATTKKNAEDFLTQLRMGKSYLHGLDKEGRPMCFVRVRLHRGGEQTEQSLERFTVYTIETARMLLRPPIDTATIVFDMTDFSMANMDYTPVKFMIKCFEANYPESLGAVLVYKAPWVFNAIWSIIRGWLDPVVAGKVHFAKNLEELSAFVPKSQIPTELGGEEAWSYTYPEPVPGENDKMKDTPAREALESERKQIVANYEATIVDWVHAGDAADKPLEERRKERDTLAEQLRHNYWKIDPYVRARTLYDRLGVLQSGGKLDFYGKESKSAEAPAAKPAVETSADDLD